jgi:hypothetical protein
MSILVVAPRRRVAGQAGSMNADGLSGLVNRVIAWADLIDPEELVRIAMARQ